MRSTFLIIGFIAITSFSVAQKTVSNSTVNVESLGSTNDLSVLINEAIKAGYDDIFIPSSTRWVWNSTVTIPTTRRINIWGNMPKSYEYGIKIRCGNNYPAIDAQGSSFSNIKGLNFIGDGRDAAREPACLIVYARMPGKESASNHVLADNVIDGSFYYCCVYNIGSEESLYSNNYVSFSGTHNPNITVRNAAYVYSGSDIFPKIISKKPRPDENSMSAITNSNEVIKSFVKGSSVFYLGYHAKDVTININFAVTYDKSNFITLESNVGGLNLSVNRVEMLKSSSLLKVKGSGAVGPINIINGSFLRSDVENNDQEVYAIDVDAAATGQIILNISPFCNFFTTVFKPDIKLIKIDRLLKASSINLNAVTEGARVIVSRPVDSRVVVNSKTLIAESGNNNSAPATNSSTTSNNFTASVELPAGKTKVVVAANGKRFNRGIATSTGNHYCYIKFNEGSFTIFASKPLNKKEAISYMVWYE